MKCVTKRTIWLFFLQLTHLYYPSNFCSQQYNKVLLIQINVRRVTGSNAIKFGTETSFNFTHCVSLIYHCMTSYGYIIVCSYMIWFYLVVLYIWSDDITSIATINLLIILVISLTSKSMSNLLITWCLLEPKNLPPQTRATNIGK